MTNKKDEIESTLDLEPIKDYEIVEETSNELVVSGDNDNENEEEADLKKVRQTFQKLIEKGMKNLDNMAEFAESAQSARGFEVLSMMHDSVMKTNKEFQSFITERNKLRKEDGGPQNVTTNNTMNFNGTTEEFRQMIKKAKDEK